MKFFNKDEIYLTADNFMDLKNSNSIELENYLEKMIIHTNKNLFVETISETLESKFFNIDWKDTTLKIFARDEDLGIYVFNNYYSIIFEQLNYSQAEFSSSMLKANLADIFSFVDYSELGSNFAWRNSNTVFPIKVLDNNISDFVKPYIMVDDLNIPKRNKSCNISFLLV